jgi:hypothetical protein
MNEEKKFSLNNKHKILAVLCLLVMVISGYVVFRSFGDSKKGESSFPQSDASKQDSIPDPPAIFSLLNGSKIDAERKNLPIVAVMIENAPAARPQSGLDKADIVYETLAEGGITRFMALFQSQEAENVGPVRSARKYFVEIAYEYSALFAHVGGSQDALSFIQKYDINDIDQYVIDKPFWRDPKRMKHGREHSMYTNTVELRKVVQNDSADFQSWLFQESESDLKDFPKKQIIDINFSFPGFRVQWEYDSSTNSYNRKMGGTVHKDALTNQPLTAKNVLVQYVPMRSAKNDSTGDMSAVDLQLIGEGEGIFFRDGEAFPLTWEKKESGGRTKFYDENEREIVFNPGLIWVELVQEGSVTYK